MHPVFLTPEVWQESNGIPGLQRVRSPCQGAAPLPPDTCVTHSENWALVTCVIAYATP